MAVGVRPPTAQYVETTSRRRDSGVSTYALAGQNKWQELRAPAIHLRVDAGREPGSDSRDVEALGGPFIFPPRGVRPQEGLTYRLSTASLDRRLRLEGGYLTSYFKKATKAAAKTRML